MVTPSEQLAERIAKRLASENILTKEAAQKIQSKLVQGTLRPEDWRMEVEIHAEKIQGKANQ